MRIRDFLLELKTHKLNGLAFGSIPRLIVYENPSHKQFKEILEHAPRGALRGFIAKNLSVYLWNNVDCWHAEVQQNMGFVIVGNGTFTITRMDIEPDAYDTEKYPPIMSDDHDYFLQTTAPTKEFLSPHFIKMVGGLLPRGLESAITKDRFDNPPTR